MSESILGPIVVLAIVAAIAGAIWGAFRLAWRWVKDPVGRVFLGLAMSVVFIVVLVTAFVAGCTLLVGTPNFR